MTSTSIRTASPSPVAAIRTIVEPMLSFITVTYGTGPIVVEMIRSITATVPEHVPYEVIVVDNPHPTAGGRALRHLQLGTHGVTVVRPASNVGFGGGCEMGALHASGELLAFVNPDLEFRPGWFSPMLSALDEPAVSIVAPVLLEPDGRIQEAGGSVTPEGWTIPTRLEADVPIVDVQYASAACWLMRAAEHERLGGFDPDYAPAYFEDVDLALRAAQLGGRCVIATGSRVVHHRGSSTPDAPDGRAQHAVFVARWPLVAWRAGRQENTASTMRRA